MDGWIKLYRQITSSSKFSDPEIFRLWILCLTKASHKDRVVLIEKKEIHLLSGQFVTGRFSLLEEYNASLPPRKKVKETTLWSWLKRLEQWGDLDIKSTNKYSVVSIVKWDDYQEGLTADCQQTDNKLTTDCQQTDTNKNVKNLENEKNKESTPTIATANAFQIYQRENYPQLSPTIVEKLHVMIDRYSEPWVIKALEEGAYYEKRYLPYVQQVLDDWKKKNHAEPWTLPRIQPQKSYGRGTKPEKPKLQRVQPTPSKKLSTEEFADMVKWAEKLDQTV